MRVVAYGVIGALLWFGMLWVLMYTIGTRRP